MMSQILIKNGRLIDPASGLDEVTNLYLSDGLIASIGDAPKDFNAAQTIDATGLVVAPGLVDVCARLREPGEEYKATLISELQAAVAGGVTSLACPPDTDPVLDEPGLVEMLKHRTKQLNLAKVYPLGALTRDLNGKNISEMNELKTAGCIGFSQASFAISNTQILWRALQYATTFDLTVFLNAQDPYLADSGVAHDGEVATRLGLKGIPSAAETLTLSTILQVAEATNTRLHIGQLSTAVGIDMVRQAKSRGLSVTCDVDISHLHLTEHDIGYFNTACHLSPPLRTHRDKDAISAGLKDGTIDVICSNHAPVDEDAKLVPFAQSEVGATGLELLLPLVLKWAEAEQVSLTTALAKVTHKPAEVLALNTDCLSIGSPADLCLFNPEAYWTVQPQALCSQGKNTPFANMELAARNMTTIVDGHVVFNT